MQCDFSLVYAVFEALGNFDLLAEFSYAQIFETIVAGFWVFSAKVFGVFAVLWL